MSQLQSTTSPCGVVVTNGARASLMGNQIYHGPVYRAPVYNINIVSGGLFLLCVPLAFYLGTQYAKVDSGERIGSVDLLSFLNSTLGRITYGRQDHLRHIKDIRYFTTGFPPVIIFRLLHSLIVSELVTHTLLTFVPFYLAGHTYLVPSSSLSET